MIVSRPITAGLFAAAMVGAAAAPATAIPHEGVADIHDAYAADALVAHPDQRLYTVLLPVTERSADAHARVAVTGAERATQLGASVAGTYSGLGGFSASMTSEQVRAFAAENPDAVVSVDAPIEGFETQPDATWGLDRIDSPNALDGQYNYVATGKGVNVYIIDSGLNMEHPDFAGRIDTTIAYDFIDRDNDASDCAGHGTHVAGTAAGTTYGVAKEATVVPVRVLDCRNRGRTSTFIAGLDHVVKSGSQPAVVNMSLGGGRSRAMDEAVARARRAGFPVAAATGNNRGDACDISPGGGDAAISVSATDRGDNLARFSNWGTCVDVLAPGARVLSSSIRGGSTLMSGTSMASPHVAGAIALYLEKNPKATVDQIADAITSTATRGAINPGRNTPDLLLNALTLSGGTSPSPTFTPTPTPTGSVSPTANPTWTFPWPWPTSTPTVTPTATSTATATPTRTWPNPWPWPTSTPTMTPTAMPTATSTPTRPNTWPWPTTTATAGR